MTRTWTNSWGDQFHTLTNFHTLKSCVTSKINIPSFLNEDFLPSMMKHDLPEAPIQGYDTNGCPSKFHSPSSLPSPPSPPHSSHSHLPLPHPNHGGEAAPETAPGSIWVQQSALPRHASTSVTSERKTDRGGRPRTGHSQPRKGLGSRVYG